MRILFLCTGNSCRSQMAEHFTRAMARTGQVKAASAGTDPVGVHPVAVQVMEEEGIEMSTASSDALSDTDLDAFDLVITLCGDARDSCPILPSGAKHLHWPLPDPAAAGGSPEQKLAAFRKVRDDIRSLLEDLLREPPGQNS